MTDLGQEKRPPCGDLGERDPQPQKVRIELTVSERDLAVSALEFVSTYRYEPDLAADDLAKKLREAPCPK